MTENTVHDFIDACDRSPDVNNIYSLPLDPRAIRRHVTRGYRFFIEIRLIFSSAIRSCVEDLLRA